MNKFNGVIWSQVGTDIFYESSDSGGGQITGSVGKIDISFSSNGDLLACTTEYLNGAGYSVSFAYVFDNGNWNPTTIASSDAPMLNSERDNDGNIYFAISNRIAGDPIGINFIKFSNGNFETLEMVDNSSHFTSYLELQFDNNNIPYVIYKPVIISNSHIKKFTTNLDINEIYKDNLSVFPNPTSHYLTISNLSLPTSFDIYNISGKLVSSGELSNNKKIDLTSLTKGIYLLKLKNRKLIKIIKK